MRFLSLALALTFTVSLLFSSGPSGALAGTGPESDFTEFQDPFAKVGEPAIADPLEPLNRVAFWINDHFYTKLLAPVLHTTPESLRRFAAEAWQWAANPLAIGEVELQVRFRDAGSELGRFMLHALIGYLGQVEPEKTIELADGREDFGRTLEAFGLGSGFYLVLPVLGPSSLRDGLGRVADFYLDPSPQMFHLNGGWRPEENESVVGDLQAYLAIRRESLDPYLFIRDAYAQQRTATPVAAGQRLASKFASVL